MRARYPELKGDIAKQFEKLGEQTFVVAGAGSAGIGIVEALCNGMVAVCGMTAAEAASRFWLVDQFGLLTDDRTDLQPEQQPFARPGSDAEAGTPLLEAVKLAQPTCLLGVSGVGGIFTDEVLAVVNAANAERPPVIMPMSNPTSRAECTAEAAFSATGGRCIFGSGSPFDDVVNAADGKLCKSNQSNNMYIFPGVGLGTLVSRSRLVSDGMLLAASKELASYTSDEDISAGMIFPDLEQIRTISARVALAVVRQALHEGLVPIEREDNGMQWAEQLESMSDEDLTDGISMRMYEPRYRPLIYKVRLLPRMLAQRLLVPCSTAASACSTADLEPGRSSTKNIIESASAASAGAGSLAKPFQRLLWKEGAARDATRTVLKSQGRGAGRPDFAEKGAEYVE